MGLLIDIGNTNTHVGKFSANSGLKGKLEFPTRLWSSDQIYKQIDKLKKFIGNEGVAMCSVVPDATKIAASIFKTRFNVEPWILTYKDVPLHFDKYPKPVSLGADRIANAVGAAHIYRAPAIVISCGTAVTIDYVDETHHFRGGAILPGISVFTKYLHEKTALLPEIEFKKYTRFYGTDTKSAMLVGLNKGFPAMIRTIIEGMIEQFKATNAIVIATGGYAKQIEKEVGVIHIVDPLLTLAGLYISWKYATEREIGK